MLCEEQGFQKISITADAGGSRMTWVSERQLDRPNLVIEFQQTQPQSPVTAMKGKWVCVCDGPCQTTLVLTHQVAVAEGDDHAAALRRMIGVIHANSTRELAAIKEVAERSLLHSFEDELAISADADSVYGQLFHAENWPILLSHCPALRVLYDDGRNQELLMTVDTPSGREEIRTVRKGERPHKLSYFQTRPPAPLRTHEGTWLIRPADRGVVVTSDHTITLVGPFASLEDERAALSRAELAIRQNTRGTLAALETYFRKEEQ